MYLILMGWLYVVLMLAAAQNSWAATAAILFFLGFLPTFFVAHLTRSRLRRRRERAMERQEKTDSGA